MQFLHGPLCFSRRGHFHVPHAERISSRISEDRCGENRTKRGEQFRQLLVGKRWWQPLDQKLGGQRVLILGKIRTTRKLRLLRTRNQQFELPCA